MPAPLPVSFAAGSSGVWQVDRIVPVVGEALPVANRLAVSEGDATLPAAGVWVLRSTTGHARDTMRSELSALSARQAGLRRPEATCVLLMPIRKSAAWWDFAQDERRAVFEEQSHHIGIGRDSLPAVSRRLHHCRELDEPFDFLTWFEFAPEDADAFAAMVERLRATPEWGYVEREVEVRLTRVEG